MDFACSLSSFVPKRVRWNGSCAVLTVLSYSILLLSGCGDNVRPPTMNRLAAFEETGRRTLAVDMDAVHQARLHTGPYRVVPGDVLEFTMPALLRAVTVAEMQAARTPGQTEQPYVGRVGPGGTIVFPAVGEIAVAGASLLEVEEKVIDAYRPYVSRRPSVYARVLEYETFNVSIIGAVANPGVYPLRRDQLSLVALLMQAGGIVEEGATVIRIGRADGTTPEYAKAADSVTARPSARFSAGAHAQVSTAVSETIATDGIQVRFQREGPLLTTGWLTLEQGNRTLVRRWLDLDSVYQKNTLVEDASDASPLIEATDFSRRLARLTSHLQTYPPGSAASPLIQDAQWQLGTDQVFVGRFSLTTTRSISREAGSGPVDGPPPAEPPSRLGDPGRDFTTLVLPVTGFNIPFHDVALQEGDTVVVEHIQEPLFSVLGLVNRPGNFPYPPNAQYNVTQAIAFAGGLDPVARPRYVTIYRLAEDDSIIRVPFKLIEDNEFTDALSIRICPGDVVAIESTPRTRVNTMIHNMVRINTGLYLTGRDLWND